MTIFRITLVAFFLNAVAMAQPEDASIPPLPQPVAPPDTSARGAEEPEFIVVAPDENTSINPGFFTDSSLNRGLARHFNALDMGGYVRLRTNYFRNAHLGTYIPSSGKHTSAFLPNLSLVDLKNNPHSDADLKTAQNNFSANMRLRLDPTLNVTEMIRAKATFDVFDNVVLGSTSERRGESFITAKRAWAEATFPIGELRFGRMPFHWGLGIMHNSGDDLGSDYGDSIDGILFSTRILDHYFMPGYAMEYTGPVAKAGGQDYPLESGAMAHIFMLGLLKRDSDFIATQKRTEGRSLFNYGFLASFRTQDFDAQGSKVDLSNLAEAANKTVKRESRIGAGSLWAAFSHQTFHIEAEVVGRVGKYQIGDKMDTDLQAQNPDMTFRARRDVWLLQSGAALESRYGFLNDRLQVGLNAGWASAHGGEGFAGAHKLPAASKPKTDFSFNPAYQVDLLLHKEVIGAVSSTAYLKPHLSYFFSQNFGVRGDVIAGLAPVKENAAGDSNWLGVEVDASTFLRTDGGFYLNLAYGILVPLQGLSHRKSEISAQEYASYGTATVAQTLQLSLGLVF